MGKEDWAPTSAFRLQGALATWQGGRGPNPALLFARCDRGLQLLERIAVVVELGCDPERPRILRGLKIVEGHILRTV